MNTKEFKKKPPEGREKTYRKKAGEEKPIEKEREGNNHTDKKEKEKTTQKEREKTIEKEREKKKTAEKKEKEKNC